MKKFIVCLFILAIFSAFVFYLGWTQIRVEPEQVGIVVSKTGGIQKNPVKNGKFSWNWEFLLPTNAVVEKFKIEPVNVDKTIKGQLPSGEVYTALYGAADIFSYYFDFSIAVTVAPEALSDLMKLNKISNNSDLREYLNKSADVIAQLAADYYLKKASEKSDFRVESVRRDDLLRYIQLYEDCPEVDVTILALKSSKLPDYELYKKLQTDYISRQFLTVDSEGYEVSELTESSDINKAAIKDKNLYEDTL